MKCSICKPIVIRLWIIALQTCTIHVFWLFLIGSINDRIFLLINSADGTYGVESAVPKSLENEFLSNWQTCTLFQPKNVWLNASKLDTSADIILSYLPGSFWTLMLMQQVYFVFPKETGLYLSVESRDRESLRYFVVHLDKWTVSKSDP